MDKQIPIQEEQILIQEEDNTDKKQQQINEEGSSEYEQEVEDELLPRPAFDVDYYFNQQQNLTQEEQEAFKYILFVQKEKQNISKERKSHLKKMPEKQITSEILETLSDIKRCEEINYNILNNWIIDALSYWKIVLANVKYVKEKSFWRGQQKRKLHNEDLLKIPKINDLCWNKSLSLPKIQDQIEQFSNIYLEWLQQNVWKEGKHKNNYHLWMYSLLILHQYYASYTNFNALASINAVIQKQYQLLLANHSLPEFQQILSSWATTTVVLIEIFQQKHLIKYLNIIN